MTEQTNIPPFFAKSVDLASRESMIAFLRGHRRYDTMGSNNASTSYAHCVKVHCLGLAGTLQDSAWDFVTAEISDWVDERTIIAAFTKAQDGRYTIIRNGRHGGYLVLVRSVYKELEYKSICQSCGTQNYGAVTTTSGNKCGVCHAEGDRGRVNYDKPPVTLEINGRGLDMYDEGVFEEWETEQLQSRVRLVQAFDATCDKIRASFIDMLTHSSMAEVEIVTTRTAKVFRCSA